MYTFNYYKRADEGAPIAFNLMRQNCSVFVRQAVKHATDIDLPTEIHLWDLVKRITPSFIGNAAGWVSGKVSVFTATVAPYIPGWVTWLVEKIKRVWLATIALWLSIVFRFFGAGCCQNVRNRRTFVLFRHGVKTLRSRPDKWNAHPPNFPHGVRFGAKHKVGRCTKNAADRTIRPITIRWRRFAGG